MVVGKLLNEAKLAVIGSGPAGYVAAIRAAQLGTETTLIEKEKVGGICLNHGCIPSKALIHAAKLKEELSEAKNYGFKVKGLKIDFPELITWKQKVVNSLIDGIEFLLKKNKINIINGKAHYINSNELLIETMKGTKRLYAEKSIIATGSKPRTLKGFEFNEGKIINSRQALNLKKLPEELTIIGAGYVGLELGLFYAMLGSKVRLIEAGKRILSLMPREAITELMKELKKHEIELHLNSRALNYELEKKKIKVSFSKGHEIKTVVSDKVLIAIGRIPNTDGLNLEKTNVKLNEKGFIVVNNQMKTNDESIYAVGDVIGGKMLAGNAFLEGKIAAENVAGLKSFFVAKTIPEIVFVKPEIALTGLTEEEALKQGIKVITGMFPLTASGKAMTENFKEGFVKVVAEKKTHELLGCLIVAPEASSLISEATLAVEASLSLEDIILSVHPHPSYSEAFMEACEDALGKAVHVFKEKIE